MAVLPFRLAWTRAWKKQRQYSRRRNSTPFVQEEKNEGSTIGSDMYEPIRLDLRTSDVGQKIHILCDRVSLSLPPGR
jgi:hypothetical protein